MKHADQSPVPSCTVKGSAKYGLQILGGLAIGILLAAIVLAFGAPNFLTLKSVKPSTSRTTAEKATLVPGSTNGTFRATTKTWPPSKTSNAAVTIAMALQRILSTVENTAAGQGDASV